MTATMAISGTALRRFFRDRSNFFFVFVLPLVLIVLIGLQFSDAASSGRVVVTGDGDLVDELETSFEQLDMVVTRESDVDNATTAVARGRADAAVEVDDDAAAAWDEGGEVSVTVVPGSQAAGQAVLQTVQTGLADLSNERAAVTALVAAGIDEATAADAFDAVGDMGPALTVTAVGDDLGEEFAGLGRFDLGAAQQLSLFVFLASLAGSASLIQSREYGVTRRELSGPLTTREVIGGEALGRFVIAMVQGVYIVLGTALLFDVDWGNMAATMVVLAAFCGVSAAAAMVLGSLMDNANAANGVGVGLGLVLAALGGSMFPPELFPDGILVVSRLTPHYWAYQAYAEIQRNGGGLADVGPEVAVLVAFILVLLPLGSWLLGKASQRAI